MRILIDDGPVCSPSKLAADHASRQRTPSLGKHLQLPAPAAAGPPAPCLVRRPFLRSRPSLDPAWGACVEPYRLSSFSPASTGRSSSSGSVLTHHSPSRPPPTPPASLSRPKASSLPADHHSGPSSGAHHSPFRPPILVADSDSAMHVLSTQPPRSTHDLQRWDAPRESISSHAPPDPTLRHQHPAQPCCPSEHGTRPVSDGSLSSSVRLRQDSHPLHCPMDPGSHPWRWQGEDWSQNHDRNRHDIDVPHTSTTPPSGWPRSVRSDPTERTTSSPSSLPVVDTPAPEHPPPRKKRKQVRNACLSCQRSSKGCDDARPCARCVRLHIADTCQSSVHRKRLPGHRLSASQKDPTHVDTARRGPRSFGLSQPQL